MFYSFMGVDEIEYIVDASKRELADGGIYVEYGSFALGTIGRIAQANPHASCWAVDTFWHHKLVDDPNHPSNYMMKAKYPEIDWSYKKMMEIVTNVRNACPNLRLKIGKTRTHYAEQQPKMQFIDADHSYSECMADFWHCWSQAAPDSLIIGHDYYHNNHHGVTQAVEDISKILGEPGIGAGSLWFYRKTK